MPDRTRTFLLELGQLLGLNHVTLFNRDVRGRRVQVIWHSWLWRRRGRGPWPRSGPFPIFRYWLLGPFDVRVFTRRVTDAM